MEKEVLGQEYDTVISSYYGDDVVVELLAGQYEFSYSASGFKA